MSPAEPCEALEKSPLDSAGHLYLAFDAYCRHLWMSKVGQDGVRLRFIILIIKLPFRELIQVDSMTSIEGKV
jgi:hypothetical protein